MKWPAVVEALLARLEADAALLALIGSVAAITQQEDGRELRVPSVEYLIVSDAEVETTERVLVQWDLFGRTTEAAVDLERRLRQLLTARMPVSVGGVAMWMLYQGSRTHADAGRGVKHRSFDVLYMPAGED